MIGALVVGALLGAGLWGVGWALIPPSRSTAVTVARLDLARTGRSTRVSAKPAGESREDRLRRLQLDAGYRVTQMLDRNGIRPAGLRRDLAIMGRTPEQHFGRVVTLLAGAIIGVPLVAAAAAQLHLPLRPTILAPAMLLLAVLVVVAEHHDLHKAADQRRREFRRALSEYEDRVAMALMGGTGLPEALPLAASVSPGWPFRVIEQVLERSRLALGTDVWEEFAALGEHLGVDELRDLGSAVGLVGEEGARVAKTLSARAASLRRREIADLAGRSAQRDSSMRVANIVLGFGFLTMLVYPMVASFLTQ